MDAYKAPASIPAMNINGSTNQSGREGNHDLLNKAIPVAATAPMANCPSAPIFQNRIRKAVNTARVVNNTGIILTRVSLNW